MAQHLLQDFVLLLVAVNPILAVPEFVAVTAKFDAAAKRRIAIQAVLIAGGAFVASWKFDITPVPILAAATALALLWRDRPQTKTEAQEAAAS